MEVRGKVKGESAGRERPSEHHLLSPLPHPPGNMGAQTSGCDHLLSPAPKPSFLYYELPPSELFSTSSGSSPPTLPFHSVESYFGNILRVSPSLPLSVKCQDSSLNHRGGASLVLQWLKICLPIQGTPVQSLVREDPTCLKATKPRHDNY